MPPATRTRRSSSNGQRHSSQNNKNNNTSSTTSIVQLQSSSRGSTIITRTTTTTTTTENDNNANNRKRNSTATTTAATNAVNNQKKKKKKKAATVTTTRTTTNSEEGNIEIGSCSYSTTTSDDDDTGRTNSTNNLQQQPSRRRSARGNSCLAELARDIVEHCKRVVFITGAGVSVASGVRPFRGQSGVWNETLWTQSTREAFRRNPLDWYNTFWLPCFMNDYTSIKPNPAHDAIECLLRRYPYHVKMITQNVDGLFSKPAPNSYNNNTIEAHGRLGLFKCIPTADSESDIDYSDSDDDEEVRPVHLGHRRKWRDSSRSIKCPYRQKQSLTADQIEPTSIRQSLKHGRRPLSEPPTCPSCGNIVEPQALLFDEGYHSHDYYEFIRMEEWLRDAEVIVFVGTSFAVRLPEATLEHARSTGKPVYNFNTYDMLEPSRTLNASNIRGKAEVTLPLLLQEVDDLQSKLDHPDPSTTTTTTTTMASSSSSSEVTRPPRLRRSSRKRRAKFP
jgi:NAD-dependent SIR2 family protein deacetylase